MHIVETKFFFLKQGKYRFWTISRNVSLIHDIDPIFNENEIVKPLNAPCLNRWIFSSPGKCTCPDDYQGSRCQKGDLITFSF